MLLDSDGNQHPIEQIVRFSNYEDFAIVRSSSVPARNTLTPEGTPPTAATPLWFAGRKPYGGIDLRVARFNSLSQEKDSDPPIIFFSGLVERGFSGGPLFDRLGAVRGVVYFGNPARQTGQAISALALTEEHLPNSQLSQYSLMAGLGVRAAPKLLGWSELPRNLSYEEFASSVIAARPTLYRLALFDPKRPPPTPFVLLGSQARQICMKLNSRPCEESPPGAAPAELWRFIPELLEPPSAREIHPDLPGTYNIHGAILVRDALSRKAVKSLSANPRLHLRLARKIFDDEMLRVTLTTDHDPLSNARAETPTSEHYIDTHGRPWIARSWKLTDEDFSIVSLGRETDDRHGHIVLAAVVRLSRVDGASVLLKYVANFTQWRNEHTQWRNEQGPNHKQE